MTWLVLHDALLLATEGGSATAGSRQKQRWVRWTRVGPLPLGYHGSEVEKIEYQSLGVHCLVRDWVV